MLAQRGDARRGVVSVHGLVCSEKEAELALQVLDLELTYSVVNESLSFPERFRKGLD
jgi:hypothetical protein